MNEKTFVSKVSQDTDKLDEDMSTVMEDGMTGLGMIEVRAMQAVNKAKDDLTLWLEDETAQFSRKLGSLAGDALDTVAVAAKTVQQEVDLGLSQYNAKVQEFADKAPGGLSKKAARYPWVTVTVFLGLGLMLGMLLKPGRRPLG